MAHPRSRKVGEQIQKEVSALLLKGLKDPRVGFVTITAVEVTPDMHLARVFFTVMGDEKARRETEAGLHSAAPFLRRELGRLLRMRYVPDLLFCYDPSLDYGNRINTLLQEIQTQRPDDQSDNEDH